MRSKTIGEAALPTTANNTKPNPQSMVKEMFGGVVPTEVVFPNPKYTIAENVSVEIRDLTINPDTYTPPDMIRPWVNEWPKGLQISPAMLMGPPPGKK